MKFLIRGMRQDDYGAILPLQKEIQRLHRTGRPDLFREGAVSYTEEAFRAALEDENGRHAVCAVIDGDGEEGEIVGFLFAWIRKRREHRNMNDEDFLIIDDICVAEKMRRQGVGRALLDRAEAAALEAGCGRMVLDVFRFNENALAFYRETGFTEEMIRMEKRTEERHE